MSSAPGGAQGVERVLEEHLQAHRVEPEPGSAQRRSARHGAPPVPAGGEPGRGDRREQEGGVVHGSRHRPGRVLGVGDRNDPELLTRPTVGLMPTMPFADEG